MTPRFVVLNAEGHIVAIRHNREDAQEIAAYFEGATVQQAGEGNPAQVEKDKADSRASEARAFESWKKDCAAYGQRLEDEARHPGQPRLLEVAPNTQEKLKATAYQAGPGCAALVIEFK